MPSTPFRCQYISDAHFEIAGFTADKDEAAIEGLARGTIDSERLEGIREERREVVEDHGLEGVEVVGLHDLILRAIEIPGAKPAAERRAFDPMAMG